LRDKLDRELGECVLQALGDADVTEVMLNSDGLLWSDSFSKGLSALDGKMSPSQAESLIGTIARLNGLNVTRECPVLECEVPHYSARFQGLLPPVTPQPCFVIRKQAPRVFPLEDYLEKGIITARQVVILRDAIHNRKNIIVAGGTGSGKTTLLNTIIAEMSALSSPNERFVILEDTYELRCSAQNHIHLHTTKSHDLLALTKTAMRLRPDRIIVGEVRGPEAHALIKVWNTGHPGGATSIHANSADSTLQRLELLIEEAGMPVQKQLIAQTIDLVLFLSRASGKRKLEQIAAVNKTLTFSDYSLEQL
jgi:type IV secretion system protein VirB11